MMRLSTMWAVDREIDGSGRSPVVDMIVERWAHEAGSARFFRSSANFIATFQHEGQRRFLRFADAGERDRDAIQAELDLLGWLDGQGLVVSMPVPSLSGALLETVEVGGRNFYAVAFAACEGDQVDSDELDEGGFRRWGDELGRLHAALKSYPDAKVAARRTWRDDLDFIERHIPQGEDAIQIEFLALQTVLQDLPMVPESFGLIHFDFELDNVVWTGESVAVLDFDDCAFSWFAADIAFALRDLFDAGRSLDDPSVRAFLDGYRAQTSIEESMVSAIPTFSRLSRLFTYARVERALDLEPGAEYPDWLNGLIGRLRDRNRSYQQSLVG